MKKSFLSVLFLQCKTSVGLFIRRDLCVFPAFRDFYANSPIFGMEAWVCRLVVRSVAGRGHRIVPVCLCAVFALLHCSNAAAANSSFPPSLPPSRFCTPLPRIQSNNLPHLRLIFPPFHPQSQSYPLTPFTIPIIDFLPRLEFDQFAVSHIVLIDMLSCEAK